ncbi:TetR/AcrR family transcriptional regulator [Convivina praedatoris]|nr:TetR/AcrR family transcriptional regulator [Convivina sp. LMG 32447]CAH1852117.1 hypothetical protein R078138_00498 [Convivina sp. LMG 32447]CAH1852814.1 hypothetical protein R077815_00619 [Convivina sp. LMG 32447]
MQDTRTKIINNALNWLSDHNYQDFSLRQIMQTAGLTTGAFYRNFRDKEELFHEITLILSQKMNQELLEHSESSGDAFDQLLTLAQRLHQKFEQEPQVMNFLFFNDSLLGIYQQKEANFAFLSEIMQLVHQVNQKNIPDQQLFVQIWSFIQGYSLLIHHGIVQYDSSLVRMTLLEFAGRNLK